MDNQKESRKAFEERLITEMLEELSVEPLCNILLYAAAYLRRSISGRESDLRTADILDKYSEKMATRVREVRE